MTSDAAIISDNSLASITTSIRDKGWAQVPGQECSIDIMRGISARLCRAFVPSIGRESYFKTFPEGELHHAPVGRKAVLGHSEGTYNPVIPPPDLCFFVSIRTIAHDAGGHLTLADGERMLEVLPSPLVDRLRDEGLIYTMQWEPRRWQDELRINSKQELNDLMACRADVDYWWDGDDLILKWHTSAIRQGWSSGREAFANGLLAHLPAIPSEIDDAQNIYCRASNGLAWGHGESLDRSDIITMIQAHADILEQRPMRQGQLIIIDNTRILHGRSKADQDVGRELVCRFGLRASQL